ncbi:hypothetical protein [Paraclostridium sordellii]|uniref:hypothetical protein n=1 Tax=Paraclostridium sordellii TaxID=1505 RepID=UPI0022E7FD7D|nr:hypothetical protein [Paeniclostridium sordellii]
MKKISLINLISNFKIKQTLTKFIPKHISKLLLLALVVGTVINFIPLSKAYIPHDFKTFINQGIGSIFWAWILTPYKKHCLKKY